MNVPFPVELRIGLNFRMCLKLRKYLSDKLNQRPAIIIFISILADIATELSPYQQNDAYHVHQVDHKYITNQEPIFLRFCAMVPKLDQGKYNVIQHQIDH